MNIKDRFERVGFTPEEKMDLTARLERAAEQEENMTDSTKRKIKRLSGGMIIGIAAACVMTAGALAAVLSPGLGNWFDISTPGAPEALESGVYRLDRTLEHNGWTMALSECVGDDTSVYIQADLTAPEGTVLGPSMGGELYGMSLLEYEGYWGGGKMEVLPDEDPTDNRVSFLIQSMFQNKSLRGETVKISIEYIREYWWEEGEDSPHKECPALLSPIEDHSWVFEDVTLDFPDQTVRLEPNVEFPWLDGTATLTQLEVSPISVKVRVEGGVCSKFLPENLNFETVGGEEVTMSDGTTIVFGGTPASSGDSVFDTSDWVDALEVTLTLKDGTVLQPTQDTLGGSGTSDGIEGTETPYLIRGISYVDSPRDSNPIRVLDPAQVDHVTVCGVEIPLPAEALEAETK